MGNLAIKSPVGSLPHPVAAPYVAVVAERLTPARWGNIVEKAIELAECGDADARKFLAGYVADQKKNAFRGPEKFQSGGERKMPTREQAVAVVALVNRLLAQNSQVIEAEAIDGGGHKAESTGTGGGGNA